MPDFEAKPSRSSPAIRNLTAFHDTSAHRLSHGELTHDNPHGDSGSSVITASTTPILKPPSRVATLSKSAEHLPIHRLAHRRAKTEIITTPHSQSTQNNNTVLHRSGHLAQGGLEDINLEAGEDKSTSTKSERGKLISGLFQGESAPIRLGLLRSSYPEEVDTRKTDKPKDSAKMTDTAVTRPAGKLQKRMTISSPLKQATSPSRFSLFSTRVQDSKPDELPEPADDEFLNLDISTALFPAGSADLPTPEAIKNLQSNAEKVIGQLQAAYKLRTFALHTALAEKSSQGEELEETQSRLQNIKNQLNGMAEKVLEQDKTMKAMAEELKIERQKRQEEEDTRKRSIILVKEPDYPTNPGVENKAIKRHNKRSSGGTFNSDSGFESGDESTTESIFSRRYDSLGSPATISSMNRASGASSPDIGSPVPQQLPSVSEVELAPSPLLKPQAPPPVTKPTSTYDRVLKGISATSFTSPFSSMTSKCSNCHGAKASDAWSVVGVLRDENRGLKTRIGELETAVDECITLVGG
ncbi:hypothetical protein FQN50_005146 [Emmonsiellopsis sp. PD_5]|nr:hypothetical protein FQN50_005146 [Emmonsiellopsis sp. PD_5]